MLPLKIFKIRMLRLAENEFHTTKFPDFSSLHRNSLTIPGFPAFLGCWTPCYCAYCVMDGKFQFCNPVPYY